MTTGDEGEAAKVRDLEEVRRKATMYPTRMLANVYVNAKKSGDTELAAVYREILKARNK